MRGQHHSFSTHEQMFWESVKVSTYAYACKWLCFPIRYIYFAPTGSDFISHFCASSSRQGLGCHTCDIRYMIHFVLAQPVYTLYTSYVITYERKYHTTCSLGILENMHFRHVFNEIITHAPVHINDFRGVRSRYVKCTG